MNATTRTLISVGVLVLMIFWLEDFFMFLMVGLLGMDFPMFGMLSLHFLKVPLIILYAVWATAWTLRGKQK